MLATTWAPSANLIGPGSLGPAGLILLYAGLMAWMRLRVLYFVGPPLFLLLAAWDEGYSFAGRQYPSGNQILGFYLLVIASGVFAMELARLGSLPSLLVALPFVFLTGGLVAMEIVGGLFQLFWQDAPDDLAILLWAILWLPLVAALGWRISGPYRQQRRAARRGRCARCGYDLRAAPQRCPECGLVVG